MLPSKKKATKKDATLARDLPGDLSPKEESVVDDQLLPDDSYAAQLSADISALICHIVLGGREQKEAERKAADRADTQ